MIRNALPAFPLQSSNAKGFQLQHSLSGSIDWLEFLKRFGGRRDFVAKLVAAALTGYHNAPVLLRDQAERGDWAAMVATAHSIKGLAGNLVAESVQALARQTEMAARAESADAAHLAIDLAQSMEQMLGELQDWLATYQGASP